jgi:hypothetical protein
VTIKSAYWDYGPWDGAKWDTPVCEITGAWTSGNGSWVGNVYVSNRATSAWTSQNGIWSGSIKLYTTINALNWETLDGWSGIINLRPPDVSKIIDQPDTWNVHATITYLKPLYNVGGTWWFNVWGERLPDWRARRQAMEEAVSAWRYTIKGAWTSQDSTWGGQVELASVPEEQLQRQIRLMFGEYVPYDEEEDMLWLL